MAAHSGSKTGSAGARGVIRVKSSLRKECRGGRAPPLPHRLYTPTVRSHPPALHRSLAIRQKAMDPRFIDDLARRLSASVPAGLTAMREDLQQNFKAVLQSTLARLDLVTRQEFDVQAGVLRRTREKLEALEARLAGLEGKQ